MYIKPEFILEQLIFPKVGLAYRILFTNSDNIDNSRYIKWLTKEERDGLKPYMMEIGGH